MLKVLTRNSSVHCLVLSPYFKKEDLHLRFFAMTRHIWCFPNAATVCQNVIDKTKILRSFQRTCLRKRIGSIWNFITTEKKANGRTTNHQTRKPVCLQKHCMMISLVQMRRWKVAKPLLGKPQKVFSLDMIMCK